MSPTRTSSRSISSALCRVARATMTPPTLTGSRSATGVSAPVRPTWMMMAFSRVRACSAGNLCADRPARRAAHEAQPLLPVDAVDLVDDAVDVVGQRRPLDAHLAVEGPHLVGRPAQLGQRIDLEAPLLEQLQVFAVRLPGARLGLAPGIGEEAQRPLGGDRRRRAGAASPRRRCADWRRSSRPPPPGARSSPGTPCAPCRPRRARRSTSGLSLPLQRVRDVLHRRAGWPSRPRRSCRRRASRRCTNSPSS